MGLKEASVTEAERGRGRAKWDEVWEFGSGPNSRLWNLFEGKLEVLKSFNQADVYLFLLTEDYFGCFVENREKMGDE